MPSSFTTVDDRSLLDAAKRLAREERRATAMLLRVLIEVDSRRLYHGEGCSSMFTWCTQVLHLSEGGAYNRIEAARAARKYPLILDLFEQSAITLTAVRLLAPHLTPDNHAALLAAARHKSKLDVQALLAALAPQPDAPTVVRKLPVRSILTLASPLIESPVAPSAASSAVFAPAAETIAAAPADVRPDITPAARHDVPPGPAASAHVLALAPDRYRIQVTVSQATHDKFRRAQRLLRHAVPSGDAAEILERALTLLVEHLERRRFAETPRPRASHGPAAARSRQIPAAVRRAVWKRDGGRCAFIGAEGRCTESAFLEFHHVEPYAAGGEATLENIALRCRAHNGYEARVFFGAMCAREAPGTWGTATGA